MATSAEARSHSRKRMSPAEQQLRYRLPVPLEEGLQIRFATQADIEPYLELVGRVYPEAPTLHVNVRELLGASNAALS
jgi:hypothetical protein